jgi:hypothetical protein
MGANAMKKQHLQTTLAPQDAPSMFCIRAPEKEGMLAEGPATTYADDQAFRSTSIKQVNYPHNPHTPARQGLP